MVQFNVVKDTISNIVSVSNKRALNAIIKDIIKYSKNYDNDNVMKCDELLTDLVNKINKNSKKDLFITGSDIDKIYSNINKILNNNNYFNWIIKNIELGFVPDHVFIKKYLYSFSYETTTYLYKNYSQEFIISSLLPFSNYNFMQKIFYNEDKLFTESEDLLLKFNKIDNVMNDLNLNIADVFNNIIQFYWPKNSEHTNQIVNNIYNNVIIYCKNKNINFDILNINNYDNSYDINIIYELIINNFKLETHSLEEIKNKINNNTKLKLLLLIPENFIKIYNELDNDKILYYLPIIFNENQLRTNNYNQKFLTLFKYLIEEENLELTHDLFLYYCKLGIPYMIEYFLENKFIPNNEIFLNLNPDKYIQCMCIFIKYNYYITDDILDEIWIKLIGNSIGVTGFIKYTIYINDIELHQKIIDRLINVRLNYKDINNLSLADLIFYTDKITLEKVILVEDYEKRKFLLEKYMKQNNNKLDINNQANKKRIIKKIIKKKVINI